MSLSNLERVETPFTPQIESGECGAAALTSILNFYGIAASLDEVRFRCGVSRDGSRASAMIEAASTYGLLCRGYSFELNDLRKCRPPLILHWEFNHFVVLEGVGQDWAWINDPAQGRRRIPIEELGRKFTGIALVFEVSAELAAKRRPRKKNWFVPIPSRMFAHWKELLAVLSCGLLSGISSVGFCIYYRGFIDQWARGRFSEVRSETAWLVLLFGLLGFIAVFAKHSLASAIDRNAESALAIFSVKRLLALPLEFFERRVPRELASRIEAARRTIRIMTRFAMEVTFSLVSSLVICIAMFMLDAVFASLACAFAILNAFTLLWVSNALKEHAAKSRRLAGRLSAMSSEIADSLDYIQAADSNRQAFESWGSVYASYSESAGRLEHISALGRVASSLAAGTGGAVLIAFGVWRIWNGTSIGEVLAIQSLAFFLLAPMARLVSSGTDAFESSGDLERIKDLFRPDPAPHIGNLRCQAEAARKEPDNTQIPLLELRNVSYGYGLKSEPVLVDFTAKLGHGKKTAIVGISGSGKSTIAKLAAGLLTPWGGNVLVDGKVIQKIPGASGIIAYVGQEPSLFEGTVSDNIRLWSKDISEADATRAASAACANDFILARKAGYSAIVEMDGANFSGGEAQMIDIARALATNPALMILDEATGYVAPETEKEIFHNILERGISMLVISQRIETVADSDEIIVLERGTIVQKGRHEELMSTDGTYRTLMIKEKADTGIAGQAPEKHIYLPGTIREIAGSGKLPSQTNSQRCDGDALLAASSVVFGHLGLKATQVKMKDSVHRPVQDTVLEIEQLCKPFSLRARKIGLKEGWWKQDCGPMLGFTRDDNSPIAIVPRRWGGYCAMNPKDGNSWFIADSQSSDCIGKEAYQFYRCLPSGECMSKFQIQTLARVPFDLFLAFFSGMAGIFITIAMSLAIAFQMSLTLSAGESPGILRLLLILVSGSVPATLLCLLQSRAAYRGKCKIDMSLHCALFDRLLSMPSELRRKLRLPELASGYLRATFLRGKMVNAFIHMATSFLLGICSLGFLFLVNWRFGIMAVIVHVFFIAIYLSSLIWLPELRKKIGEYEKRQCRKVAQIVHSIAKIRSTGTGMHFFESWLEDFTAAQKKFVAEERIVAGFEGITAFLPMFACSIVIFWTLSDQAHLHIGRLLIINAALVTSLAAMAYTMATFVKIYSTQSELKMHETPLVVKHEIEKEEEQLHTDIPGSWDIELKDISFRYDPDTLPILDSISLRIEAGKFNVIYGEPGTGKSAIARILMGLERPESGKISINGHCLNRISGVTLRRKIAGITQGAKLPPGTIFDAIAGTSGASLDEAWEAASKALCLRDIERMPAQMLTRIIAGGIAFSAGQRQRILIASIFVRKPSLVVLDESLNAVDPLSRSLILDNLMGLGSTIVCISHQRDILAKADKTLIVSKTS